MEEIANTIQNHHIKACLIWSYATVKTGDKSSWLLVVIVTYFPAHEYFEKAVRNSDF